LVKVTQEAEVLVESFDPDDVAMSADLVADAHYIIDNLGSEIDLTVIKRRLRIIQNKIERYFE
jgi:hypothetical protein